jgi:hypothetical protein
MRNEQEVGSIMSRAGFLLYGFKWRRKMAKQLSVSEGTIRLWSSGAVPTPDKVLPKLLVPIRYVHDETGKLLERIKALG